MTTQSQATASHLLASTVTSPPAPLLSNADAQSSMDGEQLVTVPVISLRMLMTSKVGVASSVGIEIVPLLLSKVTGAYTGLTSNWTGFDQLCCFSAPSLSLAWAV